MTLHKKVFLRTYALLALLTVAICVTMSVFLIVQQRSAQIQDGKLAAIFIAKNAAKFILWDDRIGLKTLLDEATKSGQAIEYAFVEVRHKPVVHTMQEGIPRGLLGLHDDLTGAAVVKVWNRKGEVLYDIGASVEGTDAIIHVGLSRAAIDLQARESLLSVWAICLSMLVLSAFLAAWVAARVTQEVNAMNSALLLDESRMAALLQLNQMSSASMPEITTFALEEAVKLTQSKIGYLAFLNEDESVKTMHAWPKATMQECAIADPTTKIGLWGEAVQQRKPVISNENDATNTFLKGYPEGHVKIVRHMNVPIFDGGRIVVVAGVGNKKENYNKSDVRQLTLLMQGMWQTIRRREVAEELRKARDELEIRVRERTRELQISGDRYDQLAKQSGTFNWEVDAQGLYTYVSRVCKTVLGYRPDELVGRMHFYDLHPKAGREEFKAAALETFKRKERFQNLLNAAQTKDGRILWLSTNGIPLLDIDGILRGYCGSDTDVTERKRIEQTLRESEERYRVLFEGNAQGISAADAETRHIVYANPSFCGMFGYTEEELARMEIMDLVPKDLQDHVTSEFEAQARGDKALAHAIPLLRKDRTIFYADINSTSVVIAGRRCMVGFLTDVTEHKRAEDQLLAANVRLEEALARAEALAKQPIATSASS